MPGITTERICLPRIRSGSEIIANLNNGSNHLPWKKVHVLGNERSGVVPIRICEPSARKCEPTTGPAPLKLRTLENIFPNRNAKVTQVKFEGLEYDIQRLWDYDGLWENDLEYLKLRLDPTWVILDKNENIAMLRKEYPEEIPYGYKIAKIKPVNESEFNVENIEVPSLKLAIERLNWILSRARISSTVFIDETRRKNGEGGAASSKAVILIANMEDGCLVRTPAIVLGKNIGGFIPILSKNGFSTIRTNEDTTPYPRDFLTSAVKNVFSDEDMKNPVRIAHNLRTIWDYEGIVDHSSQVPMFKPHALVHNL